MAEVARRRRTLGESGAALVETALVLVVVVALLGGVSVVGRERGDAARIDQLAARAARLAARTSDPVTSDLDVLAFVGSGLGGATLERLVVYRPDGPSGSPSSACQALTPTGTHPAGVAGWCTAFGSGHLAALAATSESARGCAAGSWEAAWCPAARRDHAGTPGWVGVLVEVRGPAARGVGSVDDAVRSRAQAIAALDPAPRSRP